jgi:hypothetical protein
MAMVLMALRVGELIATTPTRNDTRGPRKYPTTRTKIATIRASATGTSTVTGSLTSGFLIQEARRAMIVTTARPAYVLTHRSCLIALMMTAMDASMI